MQYVLIFFVVSFCSHIGLQSTNAYNSSKCVLNHKRWIIIKGCVEENVFLFQRNCLVCRHHERVSWFHECFLVSNTSYVTPTTIYSAEDNGILWRGGVPSGQLFPPHIWFKFGSIDAACLKMFCFLHSHERPGLVYAFHVFRRLY